MITQREGHYDRNETAMILAVFVVLKGGARETTPEKRIITGESMWREVRLRDI
jgi:hypothetical protein